MSKGGGRARRVMTRRQRQLAASAGRTRTAARLPRPARLVGRRSCVQASTRHFVSSVGEVRIAARRWSSESRRGGGCSHGRRWHRGSRLRLPRPVHLAGVADAAMKARAGPARVISPQPGATCGLPHADGRGEKARRCGSHGRRRRGRRWLPVAGPVPCCLSRSRSPVARSRSRSPVAGRRTPDARRQTPDAGRRTPRPAHTARPSRRQ